MRDSRLCLFVTMILMAGSGCTMFQRDLGPIYKISRKHRVTVEPLANAVVKCRDRRPEWERRYHRPFLDPRRRRNGVELLTINNFSPNPLTQFKRRIAARLAELEEPPSETEIIVKRFHVVVKYAAGSKAVKPSDPISIDVVDDVRFETQDEAMVRQFRRDDAYMTALKSWEKAEKKSVNAGETPPPKPKYNKFNTDNADDDTGVVADLAGDAFGVLLQSSLSALIHLPEAVADGYETLRFYANVGPPPEWAQVDPGVTCQIEGQINLRWPDGSHVSLPLKMRETERYEVFLDTSNVEVSSLLVAAIEQSARKVAGQAGAYLDGATERTSVAAKSAID